LTIQAIYSPGWFYGGQDGTQFVANPWATAEKPDSAVWIQCSMPWTQTWNTAAMAVWGILQVDFLDDAGNVQQTTFGDPSNLGNVYPSDLPPRLFVPRFLSATFALINTNVVSCGTVTFYLWG
jgi:hypothetical protein